MLIICYALIFLQAIVLRIKAENAFLFGALPICPIKPGRQQAHGIEARSIKPIHAEWLYCSAACADFNVDYIPAIGDNMTTPKHQVTFKLRYCTRI